MPWFKVDDNLAFHTKAVAAGNAAMGLWVRAGSWASQQLNDGFIPSHITALLGTPQQATRLVRAGLWHEAPGGYSFHEWDERNPKREQIEAERAAGAERKRLSRARRKVGSGEEPLVSDTSHTNVTRDAETVSQRPDPTRPDPTPNNQQPTVVGARKRGTRIDPGFIPDDAARKWLSVKHPTLDSAFILDQTERFVNHFCSQSGPRAIKSNWNLAWRNWISESVDRAQRAPTRFKSRQQETDDLFTAALIRAQAADAAEAAGQPCEGVIL